MAEKAEVLFNVNCANARLKKWLPNHPRAEDSPKTGELQFRDVRIGVNAAAAVFLGEGGSAEIIKAFFVGDSHEARFFGIGEIKAAFDFKAKHQISVDDLPPRRVELIDKIKIRIEGGPQQTIYADFSVHLEDPDDDEASHYHDQIQRDVKLVIKQAADLVDEMRAHAKGMAVTTTVPENGDLLDEQDKERAGAVGEALKAA